MFDFLKALDLCPKDWSDLVASTGEGTPYVGQVLSKAFADAQAVIILLTPDDEGRLRGSFRKENDPVTEKQLTPQARLNVIFEAGIAMGRCQERTIIVQVGDIRPFSDIGGRHTIMLDNTSEKKGELARRLFTAGCPVNTYNPKKWVDAGNFELSSPTSNYALKEPLEENYPSIQRWFNQIAKRRTNKQNKEIPYGTKKPIYNSMRAYCNFLRLTPEEIIADAKDEWLVSRTVDKHNDLLDDFIRDLEKKEGGYTTKAWNFSNCIRAFYKYNGIKITTPRIQRPHLRELRSLTTEEVRRIIKEAPIQHKSWIIATAYLGLGVRQIVKLTVDDFLTQNWKEEKQLYPVHIRQAVSGTFDYTTFIGLDAKTVLEEYFALNAFKGQQQPWKFRPTSLTWAFKRNAYKAKVIGAPDGLRDGVPKGFSDISTISLEYRLATNLQEGDVKPDWINQLTGHMRRGAIGVRNSGSHPTVKQLQDAFLKALPKIQVFDNLTSLNPPKITDFTEKREQS